MASDIGIGNKYLPPVNIQSQKYLHNIEQWTERKQIKLNVDKTKFMIMNFTDNYQINTRLEVSGQLLQQISETRLLGVLLRDDLSFKSNTHFITRKAYKRMSILHNLCKFNVPTEDLLNIYILYIRSVLEQSAVVWHSSITKGEQIEIERVQKCALRIILKENYSSYDSALKVCGLETLKARRTHLCLAFAKKCVKHEKTQDIFPLNTNENKTRWHEKFAVTFAFTDRLKNSAIPYMQRLLNASEKSKSKKNQK